MEIVLFKLMKIITSMYAVYVTDPVLLNQLVTAKETILMNVVDVTEEVFLKATVIVSVNITIVMVIAVVLLV
jgi:hypothetical protein